MTTAGQRQLTNDGYELLGPQQVANLLHVAPLTIRTWWRRGWIHPPVTMVGETPKWDRLSGKGLLLHHPKSSATRRSCPIPLILVEALQAHWAEQEVERLEAKTQVIDSGLVFTTAAGRPIEPSGLNRQFGTLCKRAGLRHERIHNLRHTAATIMRVHGGADLLDVSRLLGHSSIRVTADLYGHTLPSTQSQIANRVGDLFTQ